MLKGSGLNDSKNSLTEMSDLGSYAKAMGVGDIIQLLDPIRNDDGAMEHDDNGININREEVEQYAKTK